MDFSYLLDLAKQNQEHAKNGTGAKRYSTEVSAAKKLPKTEVKADAVKKLLAKQEEDEKKRLIDEKRKKEQLIALRSQDRKSNARVQAMLHRTKAANKAVVAEARDLQNTAVTMTGAEQPDEDDYGYVSREASDFFNKFMDKYSGSADTTDELRKRAYAAQKAKERLAREAQRKSNEDTELFRKRKSTAQEEEKRSSEPPQKELASLDKRKSRPPPPDATLSFNEILRLAAEKQKEPAAVEKKLADIPKIPKIPKIPEPDRPMTAKEKEEYLRRAKEEYERKLRRAGKLPPLNSSTPVSKAPPTAAPSKPVSKPASGSSAQASTSKAPAKIPERNEAKKLPPNKDLKAPSATGSPKTNGSLSNHKTSLPATNGASKYNKSVLEKKMSPPRMTNGVAKEKELVKNRGLPFKEAAKNREFPPRDVGKSSKEFSSKEPPKMRDFPPKDVLKSREFPPRGVIRSREFPPRDIMGKSRQFPPRDVAKMGSKRPRLESDEEDSEMDDFIDDDPQEGEDYSKYIKEIFGYDRAKYRRIESDEEECMESTFAQQMKEERISTRIGIMEDLEDMEREREEEERKKKMLQMKKKKKL